jgi:transcriptional regulator with XRE-family HTH domain
MITAIREVRRAKGMTLEDVARACVPPTTAQTIGRLETGMRTVSVGWLNRIALALGVTAADLVKLPARADIAVAAILDGGGAHAPRHARVIARPRRCLG